MLHRTGSNYRLGLLALLAAIFSLCLGCRVASPADGMFKLAEPTPANISQSANTITLTFPYAWGHVSGITIRYYVDRDPNSSDAALPIDYLNEAAFTKTGVPGSHTLRLRGFLEGYEPSDVVSIPYTM